MKPNSAPRRAASRSVRSESGGIQKYALTICKSVALGLLVLAALLLIFSFVMSRQDIPFSFLNPMSVTALILGAMCSGFLTARKLREKGMLVGAVSGLAFFLLLLFASTFSRFDVGMQALLKLVISVVSGAIGGVMGVNVSARRK